MCLKYWNKKITKLAKKMSWCDFSLLKASVFCFTLFLVTVWPAFANLVLGVAWYWWLAAGIILAIPLFKKML